jgi:hypothetical protein
MQRGFEMKLKNARNIACSAFIAILVAIIISPAMTFAGTIQLPKTGQTLFAYQKLHITAIILSSEAAIIKLPTSHSTLPKQS